MTPAQQQLQQLMRESAAPVPRSVRPRIGRVSLSDDLKPRMNSTEVRYMAHLNIRRTAGEITDYWFEGIKLRLAEKTFYTPDFLVQLATGELECHEVKGFWEDDARVKIKVAASIYPFRFIAVQAERGATWKIEEF